MGFKRPMSWHIRNGAIEKQARAEAQETKVVASLSNRPLRESAVQASAPDVAPQRGSQRGRTSGRVKWFNNAKGYGFIRQDGADDVFVHYTAIQGEGFKTLRDGDLVEFDLVTSKKGLQATNLVKIGGLDWT